MKTTPEAREGVVYDYPVGAGHVGARMLDIISSAMYGNALDVLREYIQNAADGGAGIVRVVVGEDAVIVTDDGAGMTPDDLNEARKVAISRKRRGEDVGFRGIGLYSSFAVCDELVVASRPAEGERAYGLRIDYAAIRRSIAQTSGDSSSPSLIDALAEHSEISDVDSSAFPSDDPTVRTVVQMRGAQAAFLENLSNGDGLARYLAAAVPLDFAGNAPYASAVRAALTTSVPDLRLLTVTMHRPDGTSTRFSQPTARGVLPPITIQLRDGDEVVGILWACINRERRRIRPEEARGVQVRLKGFGVGSRRYAQQFWPTGGGGTTYGWVSGEIHVLDTSVIPTADRSTFEDSPARQRLFLAIKDGFQRLNRFTMRRRAALIEIGKGISENDHQRVEGGLAALTALARSVPEFAALPPNELLDDATLPDLQAWRASQRAQGSESAGHPGGSDIPGNSAGTPSGVGSETRAQGNADSQDDQRDGFRDVALDVEGDTQSSDIENESRTPASLQAVLLALPVEWPADAEDVFDAVDGALYEALGEEQHQRALAAIQRRLRRRAWRAISPD